MYRIRLMLWGFIWGFCLQQFSSVEFLSTLYWLTALGGVVIIVALDVIIERLIKGHWR